MSAAFWQDIGHLEVLVRNAIHNELTDWSTRNYGEPRWYDDPGRILAPRRRANVAEARQRLGKAGKPDDPGCIVAELTFGFWRYMVSSLYDRTLWHGGLYRAFPGQGKRSRLYDRLVRLNDLRNRIAHHEPIHRQPLQRSHDELVQVIGWIAPELREWVEQQSTVQAAIQARISR